MAVLSLGHVPTMIGFSAFPALLPRFIEVWSLSSIEGGMVNSALFLGYTVAVPLLVSLTDRIDARRIYVASAFLGVAANVGFAALARDAPSAAAFMALYGVSLAGTYMPGLRVLGEHLPPTMIARATAYYTATFGLGAAISYVLSDLLAERYGWPAPFVAASAASLLAGALILAVAPPSRPPATSRSWLAVIDPRPVFHNRSAMAYSICYGLHSFELFTVRTWIVAFLAAAAARQAAEPVFSRPPWSQRCSRYSACSPASPAASSPSAAAGGGRSAGRWWSRADSPSRSPRHRRSPIGSSSCWRSAMASPSWSIPPRSPPGPSVRRVRLSAASPWPSTPRSASAAPSSDP
ncbi:MAG TPA: MFS transporter [Aestuariivirgaceae bacterium]|nr:MFS transporter [Aestuariivirgaceae bacterium]